MDIEVGSPFVVMFGGCSQLTPSYFLCRFVREDTQVASYCIKQSIGNSLGPIALEVTAGNITLVEGQYQLSVWEQTSASNTTPPGTDPDHSELVNAYTS